MILGKNLILSINGTNVAAAKSCQFSLKNSLISVCSPTERRVVRKVPTTYSWEMSADCLVASPANANLLLDYAKNGEELTVQFFDTTLGLSRYGQAFITNCSISGSVGSLATLSISLEGSGDLGTYSLNAKCYIGQAATITSEADVEALANEYARPSLVGFAAQPIDFGTSGYQYVWFAIPDTSAYNLTVQSQGFGVTLQDRAGSVVGKYRVWRTLNKINNIFTFVFS